MSAMAAGVGGGFSGGSQEDADAAAARAAAASAAAQSSQDLQRDAEFARQLALMSSPAPRQQQGHAVLPNADDDAVTCGVCGDRVPLAELDSHEAAHEIARAEAAARAAAAEEERRQFELLQQRYGFSDRPPPPRPGRCHHCGEAGHYRSDCPRNPNRIGAAPRLPTDPAALAAAQRREGAASAGVDIVPLLRSALLAQAKPHTTTYLCGESGLCRVLRGGGVLKRTGDT